MQFQNPAWQELAAQPLHLLVPAALLALLVLAFIAVFLLPGLIHWWRLGRLRRALQAFAPRTPPGEFRRVFAKDPRLAHLWKEFQDSLHIQREERGGQLAIVAVRSTQPAETFFNSQYVVDGRLRTEFFKHVPGIFTGIGIIGTFTGLIDGLRRFQVSDNAATVRASLESLMHSVGQAFLISASAIAAAMIVTFLEKLLLSTLYGQTEDIAQAIDAHFETGSGEDYLSRLANASEAAAGQGRALKDELVRELAEVMRAQTERQIAGLATAIASGIEKSLAAPLQQIAASVQVATVDQDAKSTERLQEVLGRFATQLDAAIGGQVQGLASMNRESGEATHEALHALQQLVDGMTHDSRSATAHMGAQMQTSLDAFGRQMSGVLDAIGDSQRRLAEDQQGHVRALVTESGATSERLSDLLADAVVQMSAASSDMARSVDALSRTTSDALAKMDAGADKLGAASSHFAAAGERVGTVMADAARLAEQLAQTSGTLTEGTTELRGGLEDYRAHREAVGHLVTELRATVALANKESGLTADVLQRIQSSTERLGEAHTQADAYLDGVSRVLGEAHQAFARSVQKTLAVANTEFHAKLSNAVGLLSSTVVELEATLGQAAPQRH